MSREATTPRWASLLEWTAVAVLTCAAAVALGDSGASVGVVEFSEQRLGPELLEEMARNLKLDTDAFLACLKQRETQKEVIDARLE